MVRRHVRSEFAADVYVFPGGKIDEADRDPALAPLLDVGSSAGIPDSTAFRVAAIRELFEEAGVLLASGAGCIDGARLENARHRLYRGEAPLREIVQSLDLRLTISQLEPIAHWITPESMPRRYDTWFYVARYPEGPAPRHDEIETVHSLWISPATALRRSQDGDFPLVFVTRTLLERMARHHSVPDLISSITPADLQPVLPRVMERDGRSVFLLPGNPGY